MLRAKQRFVCKNCGKVFYEYMPDCINGKAAAMILHPLCKKCRKHSPVGKL
jgi:transposase-like protein